MSAVNTSSPVGEATPVASLTQGLSLGHSGEILKTGNLKKLKTMKKKFFVLRCESPDYPARLEYYDSEKKFKAHLPPKRSINLRTCFNINRRTDMKQKYVIALYTKDDCFCIVLDSEEERESWLKALWALQDGGDVTDGETPKPLFEHVWKVEVANKGLGATKDLKGQYHLCLTGKTVSLVKISPDGTKSVLEFPLQNIRSFGSAQSFFYMEVGRSAVTGTGEIWMEVEDAVIAKHMNRAVDAMRSKTDDGSKHINRSASVSESSRPISMASRRQNNSLSEKQDDGGNSSVPNSNDTTSGYHDSYCEMMRGPQRFVSADHDGSALTRTGSVPYNFLYCQISQRCAQHQQQQQCRVNNNALSHPNRRRHSVSAVSVSTPGAAGCWASGFKGSPQQGTVTTGPTPLLVHHQRTYSFPLSPLPPSTSVRRGSIGTKAGQRASGTSLSSAHCSSAGRDRSDSLPSSVRASNENHAFLHGPMGPHVHHAHHPHGRNMHSHFISSCHRPSSMCSRGISHSPPVGSSPVSPASGACSTDSADSLSIDEGDNWVDGGDSTLIGISSRYATNHPLTPESPIEEENCDDYVHWNGPSGLDSGVGDDEKVNNYMPMDRSSATLSLPIQQPISGSCRKVSPGRGNLGSNLKSGTSPSHSNYMEMNSPCGSSPLETPGTYMVMSPGNAPDGIRNAAFYSRGIQQMHTAPNSANHSRTSSLAEETPDGYIPMMPGQTDDGYVDMDPQTVDGQEDFHHGEMSPSSSCSITSGTPSTDLRFSEYPLEKVNSYLTPSEEEETGERPTRCYSVGSKPDSLNKKNRLDFINQTDCSRVRAFSVGSRNAPGSKYMSRPLGHDIHATRHTLQMGGHLPANHQRNHQQTGGGKKSSSAPILSNPLSSSPMNRQILGGSHSSVEPMDDLMEMDFSPSVPKSNRNKSVGKSGGRSKSTTVNDYMSMSLADRDRLSVPGGPSHHSSQSSVASSFSTAEGADVSSHVGSPRLFDTIGPGSPPKPSMLRSVYSNAVGRSPPENIARSPPNRTTASPRSAVARMSCISELKPQNFPTTTPSPPIKPSLLATNNASMASMAAKMSKMAVSSPYVEMNPPNQSSKPVIATSSASKSLSESSPYVEMKGRNASGGPATAVSVVSASSKQNIQPSSANNENYMDMSFKPRRTSVPECSSTSDGYVEMGWRPADQESESKPRKISLDSQNSSINDDYMNMTGGSLGNSRNRRERRSSAKKDRNQLRSQPINIQQPPQQSRKIAMDTPPKAAPGFLPLGTSLDSQSPLSSPFSSLGRNRSRKSSKDSCSGASGLTTPTGSNSTIFPISLNSPGSPSSAAPSLTSGASFDKSDKVPADMSSGTLRLSYPGAETAKTSMNTPTYNKQELPKHDYVNFNPNSSESVSTVPKGKVEDDAGDYAIMCPVLSSIKSESQKKSSPASVSKSNTSTISKLQTDTGLGLSKASLSGDFSRSTSKPLTVSSLLGMNNLSPTSKSGESQNNLNLSVSNAVTSPRLLPSKQVSVVFSVKETPNTSCGSEPLSGGIAENSSSVATNEAAEKSVDLDSSDASNTQPPPIVHSSPNVSPCPSPCLNPSPGSEGSLSQISPSSPANMAGGDFREKKMSSGSDSSTASRDSQLLVRKYSAGSMSPNGNGGKKEGNGSNGKSCSKEANRRLSCPSKSSVSRQVSVSSDVSDASQMDESRTSDPGTSLSRQTSSSSASGETSSSTLALAEKRSLSCSPVPSSASPVPRPAEREINYASLDLRTGPEAEDSSSRSPRGLKTQGSINESQSSTSSPSPNPPGPGGTFTYAQIDFEKSEELRLLSAVKNVKP